MTRHKLPNRRPSETRRVDSGDHTFYMTVGYDQGQPYEIFVTGRGKSGTVFDYLLSDVGVLISLALQHGVSVADLADAMVRREDGEPGSVVGQVLAEIADEMKGRVVA